jgi:hypothetical protein
MYRVARIGISRNAVRVGCGIAMRVGMISGRIWLDALEANALTKYLLLR